MPAYDYRCNQCGRALTLFYKTYAAYDAAEKTCPHCGSADLTRIIANIAVQTGETSYRSMTSGEMLSVLEGGKRDEVEKLYREVGADPAKLAAQAGQIQQAKKRAKPDQPS
jgi:putative FmdB family regulatory protein